MRIGLPKRLNTAYGVVAVLLAMSLAACTGEPESSGAPPQLRRLTEAQYRHSVADIFGGDIDVVGRFEPDMRVDGLLAVGTSAVSITPGGLEQYEAVAREIARQVVDPARRDTLVGCAPGADDADGRRCAASFFSRYGRRLYRRPLTQDELHAVIAESQAAGQRLGDFHAGLGAGLVGLLSGPEFLFRVDNTIAVSTGKPVLDGWSKATRLSYFLWNTAPDEELLEAAGRGELDDDAGLARQVDRLLASPRYVEGVRAFFDDFLQLDTTDTLSKDTLIYPAFSSAVAVDAREQTLRTVAELLVTQRADYRALFTTRWMAINRTLGPLYDVPVAEKGWTAHEFPEGDPRTGLLTQVSFLALHSHPGRTSPTLRGKAMREILMCEKIPTPPANVNFTIVQDVSNPNLKTTRARVEAHLSDPECASCHKLTDPIGLALEKFDGAGQFRRDENGAPIDTKGELDKAGFEGAAELGQVLSRSPAVTSCLVQSTWRYATGRSVDRSERKLVEYLKKRFAGNGYRLPDLMRVIATSKAFYAVAPFEDASTPREGIVQESKS